MKTIINVMENTVAIFFFIFLFVSMVDAKRRDVFDIIEKRIGGVETRISIVETRINSDNELAKSLQQNLEELNNSMINFKDQMCPTMHQQTGKEKQTSSTKHVELPKSSQILVSLGLNREKQWTRNQVEKLSSLVSEQTDLLYKNFSQLTNELKDGKEEFESTLEMINATINDKMQTKLSKLDEIITNNVKDMKEVSAKIDNKIQTKLSKLDERITNNVKDMKEVSAKIDDKFQTKLRKADEIITTIFKVLHEVSLKSNTTEKLISAQQREIETLKEIQAKLLNALIPANYDFTCPSGWRQYSSFCYWHVKEKKTFSEARAHCKRLGATVCDIGNEAENTFIDRFKGIFSGITGQWIGYSDEKEEGTWISERTGQPASFTKFHTSEMNGGTDENCAVLIYGVWLDSSCDDDMLRFICKKSANIDFKL